LSARITIALDVMGGDQAPRMVLKGAEKSLKRYPQAHFLLFGDDAKIKPLLTKMPRLAGRSQIHHTEEFVTNEAKPSVALRTGRRSSMRLAIDAVADGRADGIVSAGNTGALMAMAKFALKMLPGIDRPAIASFFPTRRGESVMLDLGANIECDADNLVQFALMGDAFARSVLGLAQPTVGLLNVGSEDLKGNDAVRAAATKLRMENSPVKFYGFIEGNDIAAGTVDVIVTDGFAGNVILKVSESLSEMVEKLLREEIKRTLQASVGFLLSRSAFRRFKQRLDYSEYGGAPLLGVKGCVIICHGRSSAKAIKNAIRFAAEFSRRGLAETIQAQIAELHSREERLAKA